MKNDVFCQDRLGTNIIKRWNWSQKPTRRSLAGRELVTGRPLRRSPLYTRLIEKHATFGNKFGERTVLFSHLCI